MKYERAQWRVSGRVQGVGYRAATHRVANELGLSGWVKNLKDGSVEVYAEGTNYKIEQLLAWCRQGPPLASVDTVEELSAREAITRPQFATFEVRRGS